MELTYEKISKLISKERMVKIALAVMSQTHSSVKPKAPSQKMPMPAPTSRGAFEAGKKPAKVEDNLSGIELNPGGIYDGSSEWQKKKDPTS